ncbi:MAG: HDOD domain-containing protein, partial [Solirubrobacteraceae bacterium]
MTVERCIRVTTPARTVIDCADTLTYAELRVLADHGVRLDAAAIRRAQQRAPNRRGAAGITRLLGEEIRTRSALERAFRPSPPAKPTTSATPRSWPPAGGSSASPTTRSSTSPAPSPPGLQRCSPSRPSDLQGFFGQGSINRPPLPIGGLVTVSPVPGPADISMTPPTAAAPTAPATPVAPARTEGGHNEGHGRRLTAAFEALEAFPALAESRDRVLRLVSAERVSPGDVVAAVESDVALAISVLRLANQVEGKSRGRIESVVQGVELLSPEAVQGLAARARTFDFFERSSVWDAAPERFRLHGVATQRAADRLATEAGYEHRDRLMVTALLHDIGKLVLMHAYPGYPAQVHGNARTPEERIHRERRELGVDHALVGGVLARRWGLPKSVAAVIER